MNPEELREYMDGALMNKDYNFKDLETQKMLSSQYATLYSKIIADGNWKWQQHKFYATVSLVIWAVVGWAYQRDDYLVLLFVAFLGFLNGISWREMTRHSLISVRAKYTILKHIEGYLPAKIATVDWNYSKDHLGYAAITDHESLWINFYIISFAVAMAFVSCLLLPNMDINLHKNLYIRILVFCTVLLVSYLVFYITVKRLKSIIAFFSPSK